MARRVSRQRQGELLIHKWWVNIILALIGLGASALFTLMATHSDSWLEYTLSLVFLAAGLSLALRGLKFASK